MQYTDATHDPSLESWVESAQDPHGDFPIQNLPFGVFSHPDTGDEPRIGVAIGDQVLDVRGAVEARLLDDAGPEGCCALCGASLNPFMSKGRAVWQKARTAISALLAKDNPKLRDDAALRSKLLLPVSDVTMHLPAVIGDYTDFYASVHHATNIGSMFRPDNPLLPNYKHLPVGYHGRASSIVVSGTAVRRPMGQIRPSDDEPPTFGACRLLDYELELGFFIGPGTAMGQRVPMAEASGRIFGMCIVNDWSARDVQKWEYQPLGPFNAKNFATTISPWVVTLEALGPYRVAGPPRPPEGSADDPPMLDYLKPADDMGLDITVEVWLASEQMRAASPSLAGRGSGGGSKTATDPPPNLPPAPRNRGEGFELDPSGAVLISRGSFADMYWTIAQMLAHHTSTGCNLRPGDLMASGTISGPSEDSRGCLLERTWRGQNPITLPDGTQRKLLQDGDEVIIRAYCQREGAARIGFGDCRGVVLPVK